MSVSVIIPTYNRAELVQKTIDSALSQSYTDREIIVIDDGSTDDTEQQLQRYGEEIAYIRQDNRGLNAARNRALEVATGEYIALLDSDDLWLDFKLQLETEILDEYQDAGFVFSDFFILKPDGQRKPHGLHTWYAEPPNWREMYSSSVAFSAKFDYTSTALGNPAVDLYFGDIYHASIFAPRVLPSASLFRRSMVEGFLRFNEHDSTCGDWEFFANLSNRHGAIFIDLETALNRSHEDAVRLTRVDPKIQLSRRIAMVDRVWSANHGYYSEHRKEIDAEKLRLYTQLIKLQLLDGQMEAARSSLEAVDRLQSDTSSAVLPLYRLLAHVPGTPVALNLLRSIKQMLH